MKLGVHTGYFMDAWDADPLPLIPRARRAGCDVVEISLYSRLPDRLEHLRDAAATEGVELTFTTGLAPHTDVSSADAATRAAGIAYLEQCLDTVAAAGGRVLSGVLYAPWGERTGRDLDARRDRAADAIARVAARAETLDIDVGIEAINRYETDLVTTVRDALTIAARAASPRVGLLLDVFHAQLEEPRLDAAIAEAGAAIRHVHLAENHRGLPGTGSVPWPAVLDALRAARYAGRAVIEAFTRPGTSVAHDTATWVPRGRTGDLDRDLAASITYLRELGW